MTAHVFPALLSTLLVACTGTPAEDTGTPTETDADTDTDTDTDTDADTDADTIVFDVVLLEFASGNAIEGATVTYEGESVTTDEFGAAMLEVASSTNIEMTLDADGFRETHLLHYAPPTDLALATLLPSDATAAALAGALGVTLDPDKAIVAVSVVDFTPGVDELFADLAGVSVDLDVAYDAAVVPDSSSGLGIALGNTTLPASRSTVVFLNVESGTVTPAIQPPEGHLCAFGHASFSAAANSYVSSAYYCD